MADISNMWSVLGTTASSPISSVNMIERGITPISLIIHTNPGLHIWN